MRFIFHTVLWFYLPPVIFMAMIFGGSSQEGVPEWFPNFLDYLLSLKYTDKAIHTSEYAILSLLWLRAFTAGRFLQATGRQMLGACLIGLFYGMTDEIHQMFVPNRTPDFFDVLADGIGSGIGVIWIYLWRSRNTNTEL